MLGTKCHQNFVITRHDATTRQYPAADLFHQQGVIHAPGIIGPRAQPFLAQSLPRALAPFGKWKKSVIHLAINERVGETLPLLRLDKIFLGSRMDFDPLAPIRGRSR